MNGYENRAGLWPNSQVAWELRNRLGSWGENGTWFHPRPHQQGGSKGRSPSPPKADPPSREAFQSPQASGQHLTSWVVALQSTNASVEVGAMSDRLVGELSLDK